MQSRLMRSESDPAKINDRRYYLKHREQILAKQREYYRLNRQRILERDKIRNARPLSPDELRAKRKRLAANARLYRLRHREAFNARQREIYRRTAERCRERSQEYRLRNPDKIREYSNRYYRLNWQRLREYNKQRRADHRGWYSNYAKSPACMDTRKRAKANRRARENGCVVSSQRLISAWQRKWLGRKRVTCYWCGRSFPPKKCQSDHIIPLCKGGSHSVENLCISCKPCNSGKSGFDLSVWNGKIKEPILI